MWINREIAPFLRQECKVGEKISESQNKHLIEIFSGIKAFQGAEAKSPNQNSSQASDNQAPCDKISHFQSPLAALIDKKHILAQQYLCIDSELLAHIPLCSHPNPKQILLFDTLNLQIANECLKHSVSIDCVQERASLEVLSEVFPQFAKVMNNKQFALYAQAMDLEIKKYDVIIADSRLNKHQIDGLSRMLSNEGILILQAPQPFLDIDGFKNALNDCSAFFSIIMPFMPHMSVFNDKSYIFASKRYHPTADMILQKIDLLPDLCYYNAKMHEAAFALPNCIFNQIADIARF